MKKCENNRRTAVKIAALFFTVFLFLIAVKSPILAQEKETVIRVGFFELPGFNEYDDLGNPTGYNVDYLNYIAKHAGWKYEYVKAYSWPEALKMLKNHEVDIISPSRKTRERETQFAFTKQAFGTEYSSILTLDTNYDLKYEDFTKFSNIKFGCVESFVGKGDFLNYAKLKGFTPKVTYYKDTNALLSALNVGEVDAIVANLMIAKENMKVLGRFSPDSYYYMLNKDNEYLLNRMNDIMTHIKVIHTEFEGELTEKYFEFYNIAAFTKEELDYIENAPEFAVGYITDWEPISYKNTKTGELEGITRDILDRICQISGLKFKYVPLPQGKITYDYLRKNKIMLVSNVERNGANVSFDEVGVSNSYLNTQKIVVGKNAKLDENNPFKIALSTGSQTLEKVVKDKYPKAEILLYDTIGDCFNAVLSDEADVLIQNKYAVERYLHKPKYEKLIVIPSEFIEDELALGTIIGNEETREEDKLLSDKCLVSIINKSIAEISENDLSEIMTRHTINNPYKFTLSDFYDRYQYFVIALAICIVIVILITVYTFRIRAKNTKNLKANETKLINITNNINGGVVVLLPNKGLEITFANEGFLSLIQYSKEEYDVLRHNNYVTYVHPDDINVLNKIVNDGNIGEHISVRLRLLRKDSTFVPTLFNGTLSLSHTGQRELYCVIMDISEQLNIMEKLEEEQERYQLLIEKSNDMIFDFDLETKEISIANNFRKEFGWTLPKFLETITVEKVCSIWQIHEEDRKVLYDSISLVLKDNIDAECKVRLKKENFLYHWCSISHNIMKKNGKSIRIIGKVTDINEEVKEKERLFKKTQTDLLTGLYNKEAFRMIGEKYFNESDCENSAIIFIDLDNFKEVNDLLGHMIGDKAIKDAARKMQVIFSQHDLISRFGGDEFCVLVKDIPLETLCDKLIWMVDKMKEVYNNDKQSVTITISAGIALSSGDGNDFSNLMNCADQALYSAKENGKNQFIIYSNDLELEGYKGRRD